MQIEIKTKIQGMFLENPEKAFSLFEDELIKLLEEITAMFHNKVDKFTPRGVTGDLAGGTFREIRGKGIKAMGILGNPIIYGARVEFGEPYTPDFAALTEWARLKLNLPLRHAFAVAKIIRRNISNQGMYHVARMFKRGFEAGKPSADKIIEQTVNRIIARWS